MTGTLQEIFLKLRQKVEAEDNSKTSTKKRKLVFQGQPAPPPSNVASTEEDAETVDTHFYQMLKRHKESVEKCEREKETNEKEFLEFQRKIYDLHAVYLFGLQKVANLQDLRNAPDAILPGNFPTSTGNNNKSDSNR